MSNVPRKVINIVCFVIEFSNKSHLKKAHVRKKRHKEDIVVVVVVVVVLCRAHWNVLLMGWDLKMTNKLNFHLYLSRRPIQKGRENRKKKLGRKFVWVLWNGSRVWKRIPLVLRCKINGLLNSHWEIGGIYCGSCTADDVETIPSVRLIVMGQNDELMWMFQ